MCNMAKICRVEKSCFAFMQRNIRNSFDVKAKCRKN